MRPLWKGAISFGLVHIPIKVYPATEQRDVAFHQLHQVCGSRIRYQRVCPHCRRDVAPEEIVRGYEYDKDRYVIITDEELEELSVPGTRSIEIQQFVDAAEIDPIYFDRSYYLEPADGGSRAYALLRQALNDTGRIGLARVVLRTKGSLCALRVREDAVVMETMHYPDEIRPTRALTGLAQQVSVNERELAMAIQLVENLTEPFDPARYDDQYRQAVLELVREKVRGEQIARPPEPPPSERIADLMAALEASLRATAPGGEAEGPKPVSVAPVTGGHRGRRRRG
ncbi:MAG: Ku protein [Firmicutes bacterium]|nr:Ku protein [Bacillota bacterium]